MPGYSQARANGVNAKGHMAGIAGNPLGWSVNVAIFHDGEKATVLTPSTIQSGTATALNDRDQVVGFNTDLAPPYAIHGMLWTNGKAHELITLVDHPEGWTGLQLTAIGADGAIAGVGMKDGAWTAFLLEPIRP